MKLATFLEGPIPGRVLETEPSPQLVIKADPPQLVGYKLQLRDVVWLEVYLE